MGQVVNEGIFSDSQLLFLVFALLWPYLGRYWVSGSIGRMGGDACSLKRQCPGGAASSCAGSRESTEGSIFGWCLGLLSMSRPSEATAQVG